MKDRGLGREAGRGRQKDDLPDHASAESEEPARDREGEQRFSLADSHEVSVPGEGPRPLFSAGPAVRPIKSLLCIGLGMALGSGRICERIYGQAESMTPEMWHSAPCGRFGDE